MSFRSRVLDYMETLRFPVLLIAAATLFGINVLIPDAFPFIDEILLGLVTVILSREKKRRTQPDDNSENSTG